MPPLSAKPHRPSRSRQGNRDRPLDLATGKATVVVPRFAASPKWSPDGRRILFWSDRGGTKEIWTVNGDGSGAARLTDGGDGYHEADWSPNGTRTCSGGSRRAVAAGTSG